MGGPQVTELAQSFAALDTTGNGMLSFQELEAGLVAQGVEVSGLSDLFAHIDLDRSGAIDYVEFLAAVLPMQESLVDNALWKAFCKFDLDRRGRIGGECLRRFLKDANGAEIDAIIAEWDADGDGEIS